MDIKLVVDKLQFGLKCVLAGKKAVIGISGGVDSAVVAALCVKAVGKDNVIGIQMPYGNQSTKDGSMLIKHLDIKEYYFDISHEVNSFSGVMSMLPNFHDKLINGNIRARIRMIILYTFAGGYNGLVIGTGNKTELLLGYFTKFGDGGCDVEPIGNLFKTEVFELARYLGVPDCIINKLPSAELWEGQTDEGEIGMTYAEMDGILCGLETNEFTDRQFVRERYGEDKVNVILKRIDASEHKRNMPQYILIDGT